MSNHRHDHNPIGLIGLVTTVIAVPIAAANPLPGLRDIAAVLPSLVDLVTAVRRKRLCHRQLGAAVQIGIHYADEVLDISCSKPAFVRDSPGAWRGPNANARLALDGRCCCPGRATSRQADV